MRGELISPPAPLLPGEREGQPAGLAQAFVLGYNWDKVGHDGGMMDDGQDT